MLRFVEAKNGRHLQPRISCTQTKAVGIQRSPVYRNTSNRDATRLEDAMHFYTVTTFKYVEGGPDREAREVV